MSAITRCVSLTALIALFGVATASEVKGPVHISADGVTHYDGDTARFHAAMEADERGGKTSTPGHIQSRRLADIARAEARRAADEARAMGLAVRRATARAAAEARDEARAAADAGREAAREAAREAREAARRARREARVRIERAKAETDEAMRDVRERLAEAHRLIESRRRDLDDRQENSWDDIVEIRDGTIVRCSDPAKHPGTGCTPYTPEEKARLAAEVEAANAQARAAMAEAQAGLKAAERALDWESRP